MKNQMLKNIALGFISVFVVSGVVYGFSWWEGVENAADGESLTHTVWNSLVDGVVKKTGSIAETITWVKTFSSSPIVPSPTASWQVASKGYVDTQNSVEAQRLPTAWVNFDGSSCTWWWGSNECTIRSQYNITRIVRNSQWAYTAYFTTAMDNTNYTLIWWAYWEGDAVRQVAMLNPRGTNALTTSVKVVHAYANSGTHWVYDYNEANFVIYWWVN